MTENPGEPRSGSKLENTSRQRGKTKLCLRAAKSATSVRSLPVCRDLSLLHRYAACPSGGFFANPQLSGRWSFIRSRPKRRIRSRADENGGEGPRIETDRSVRPILGQMGAAVFRSEHRRYLRCLSSKGVTQTDRLVATIIGSNFPNRRTVAARGLFDGDRKRLPSSARRFSPFLSLGGLEVKRLPTVDGSVVRLQFRLLLLLAVPPFPIPASRNRYRTQQKQIGC